MGFDNTCIVSGRLNVLRVIPRLYGWVYKILRLFPLVVDHSVVVITSGSLSKRLQIESYGWSIFDFWIPHLMFKFNRHKDGILICFPILILSTLCGKPMRGRQKAFFC